jgi:hypothetical protein
MHWFQRAPQVSRARRQCKGQRRSNERGTRQTASCALSRLSAMRVQIGRNRADRHPIPVILSIPQRCASLSLLSATILGDCGYPHHGRGLFQRDQKFGQDTPR